MSRRTLKWLGISNYRNLADQTIVLSDLNILIAPNGSGKSNLLNLLLFFKNCLIDNEQGETRLHKALNQLGYRITDAKNKNTIVTFILGFNKPTYPIHNTLTYFDLSLQVRSPETIIVNHEILASIEEGNAKKPPYYFYKFHDNAYGPGVYSRSTTSKVNSNTKFVTINNASQNELMLADIERSLDTSQYSPEKTPLYAERRQLLDNMKQWQFYNGNHMDMAMIRDEKPSPRIRTKFLDSNGKNLKTVIFNLERDSLQFIDSINYEMKNLLPDVKKIRSTSDGDLVKIEFFWHGVDDKMPFYIDDLSDGTVRMLCWATVLLSPDPPPLLVIEEPEVGLHTAWISTLATWIKRASQHSQVIISTHSPELLDQFTDTPECVHVFNTNESKNNTVTILNKERISAWLQDGYQLGDLYRIGEPALGGWPW